MNVECSSTLKNLNTLHEMTWKILKSCMSYSKRKTPLCILNTFGRARNTLYPLSQSNSPFLLVFGFFFFSLYNTGVWTQGLHLEPLLHYFCVCVCVCVWWFFSPGSLLVSLSWVPRIKGASCPLCAWWALKGKQIPIVHGSGVPSRELLYLLPVEPQKCVPGLWECSLLLWVALMGRSLLCLWSKFEHCLKHIKYVIPKTGSLNNFWW
jgi:hypothetical protein